MEEETCEIREECKWHLCSAL